MNDIPMLRRNQSSLNQGLNTNVISMITDKSKKGRGRPKKQHNDFDTEYEPIVISTPVQQRFIQVEEERPLKKALLEVRGKKQIETKDITKKTVSFEKDELVNETKDSNNQRPEIQSNLPIYNQPIQYNYQPQFKANQNRNLEGLLGFF
jgi:hypothetical protein